MYHSDDARDTVSDLDVLTAGCYEDPTVADALHEMYACEADITPEELAEMAARNAAAEADGLDVSAFAGFGDLTPRRHAEIMAMAPTGTGWIAVLGYSGDPAKPVTAELRRGTPNGPDVIKIGKFCTAENALTAAVLFLINMTLIEMGHGDDATREAIRAQIEYAKR